MPKEHKPKISVIIVTSNNRTHIGECFDSVLCQPFSDIEVIAVDVLSTDGTKELISETAEEDRRVIFLADSMGSIGRAKNKAIDYARAPYIVMVEPEDYIDGKMLGHLYHSMEEDPEADMMNCEVDSFGDEAFGKSNRDIKRQYRDANKMDDRVRQRESRLFRWGLFENMSIYRASFLREQNIRHYDAPGYGRQNVAFRFLAMEKGRCNLSAIIHYSNFP